MIVIWDNVDWLMRGWSFVPHLCTILIGQSDIIDGRCLKVKVERKWIDLILVQLSVIVHKWKKHWHYVCPCDLWLIHTLHFICLEKLWTAFLFRCYLFCMLEGFPMFLKVIFFFIYSKPKWLHWKMVALGRWVKGSCLLFFTLQGQRGGGGQALWPHLFAGSKLEPGLSQWPHPPWPSSLVFLFYFAHLMFKT